MSAQVSDRRQYVLTVAVVVVGVPLLIYILFIADPLFIGFGFGFLVFLCIFYLVYRFVRAHERIADALEVRNERSGPMNER
ncbi:glycerol ABC transporter substrate-binding protein [Halococcus sp. IIIV-5B]|uniref:glycerol ABC transporter substrate-binding protein n=1 Tax=Halococcus sp. IIIV-5B TaxID=2321230 RepID=UPI000E7163C1|nr:glycerol ABC transporter substrate-binding protein [Halococcus sp. IIIV-5B]RJT01204.1 glycerol ABC transporter substrate-binding protein [Halococcus sp. IIIV-5B]